MTSISSWIARLVVLRSPATMMPQAGPCDVAGAAALCSLSRSLRRLSICWRMLVAHRAVQLCLLCLSFFFLPGALWWPRPSMVWQFATRKGMPVGDTNSAWWGLGWAGLG